MGPYVSKRSSNVRPQIQHNSVKKNLQIEQNQPFSDDRIVNTQLVENTDTCNSLPIICVKIAGKEILGLVDSGASVSILENNFFKLIEHDKTIKYYDIDVNVKSITGDKLSISKCVSLDINIGNKTVRQKMYVVHNSLTKYYQAIFGYDFLKQHAFKLCLLSNTLTSGNTVIKLRDAYTSNINNISINYGRIVNKSILGPNESKSIALKLDSSICKKGPIMLVPCLKNSAIELKNSKCSVTDDRNMLVTISNLSTENIQLNKNMKICTVNTNFDNRDINYIKTLKHSELKESDFQLSHLDPDLKSQLLELIMEYADIFSKRLYTIGRTHEITPNLTVNYSQLTSSRPYRVPQALLGDLKRQLQELQEANIIEHSNSYVSSPLLMIKKKNPSNDPKQQKWRIVIDYRAINNHIKYPRYRLPLTNQLLENLTGSKYFSSLDLHSSFWQIPLKPEDRDITTFGTPFGNFRYITMPQGMNASSETFCQLADKILAPITDLNISNFVDDFCAGSKTASQMLFKLRKLFQRFREFGLTLNPNKCIFFQTEITFLGHKLNDKGIKPLDENVKKILDFPTPNTVRKVRRFLGCVSYYRKFVNNFSHLATPLTNLIRKNQKFRWNPEAQFAFDTLKEKLSKPPILVHPDFDREFILSCDASDIALGAMLGQKDDSNIIHPIAYFSKKLNATQMNYTIMEKELLAIIEAIKSFKYYLYARNFTIRCDNMALTKLSKLESVNSRIARSFAFLSEFNYKFEHIKSSENNIADALSRDFFPSEIRKTKNSPPKSREIPTTLNDSQLTNISTKIPKTKKLSPIPSKYEIEKNNTSTKTLSSLQSFPIPQKQTPSKNLNTWSIGAGLRNLGNTCYMNVVLQTLAHSVPLVKYLFNKNNFPCENTQACMICILKRHVELIQKNSGQIIEPIEVCNYVQFSTSQFQCGRQEDAHEFLYFILDKLRQCSKNHCIQRDENSNFHENGNVIQDILEGITRNEIICASCLKTNLTFDPVIDFNLGIGQNTKTLQQALDKFMQSENTYNSYHCSNCKSNTHAIKKFSISKPPFMAIFQLKRFSFNCSNIQKNNKYVAYPEKLNFSPYLSDAQTEPLWYKLNAVIVHSGHTHTNGHYFCYVKDSVDNWFLMNDSYVKQVSLSEVLQQNAYLLIYSQCNTNELNELHAPPSDVTKNSKRSLTNEITTHSSDFLINSILIDLPTIDEIKHAQRLDVKLSKIISHLKNPTNHTSKLYPNYLLKDNLLMHSAFIPKFRKTTKILQIVIPDKFKPQILASKHMPHYGLFKTYNAIREKYFWTNLYSDTKNYINSCKECIAFKSPNKLPPIPLQRNFIPSRPMQMVSCDHVGKLPCTDKGNIYILSFLDHFTKYMKLYAVPNQNAQTTAEKFLDFVSIFGMPEKLLSDRGTAFTSDMFKNLCKQFGVTKLFTTPFHPQTNGQSEIINKNIKKSLAIFAQNTPQWDNHLNHYALLYNSSIHVATQEKPAYLHLGYDPLLPIDMLLNTQSPDKTTYPDFVTQKTSEMQYVYKHINEQLLKAAEHQENYQHKKAKYRQLHEGQLVFLFSPQADRNSQTVKKRNFFGPYRISKKHNEVDYTIEHATDPSKKPVKVHASRLLPYTTRKPHLNVVNSHHDKKSNDQLPTYTPPCTDDLHNIYEDLNYKDVLVFNASQNKPQSPPSPLVSNINCPIPNNASSVNNHELHTPSSPDSDSTITYSLSPEARSSNAVNGPTLQRSPYLLRSKNLADKLFEWSLSCTE